MNFFERVSLKVLGLQGNNDISETIVQNSIISLKAALKIWIFHF